MSIQSTTNRNDYIGNGATNVYPYSFRIFASSDLRVTVRDTNGVETELTINTDYTVSGVGALSGGSITLVDASQAWLTSGDLTDDYVLTIRRVRPLTQETDIRTQGSFLAETHEDAFDHGIMVAQQQQDEISRSVRLPETIASSDFDASLPSSVTENPGKVIAVNSTGDGLELVADASAIGLPVTVANGGTGSAAALTNNRIMKSAAGKIVENDALTPNKVVLSDASGLLVSSSYGESDIGGSDSSFNISNLGIAATVSGFALTVALKGKDGNNPSASNIVKIGFKSRLSPTVGAYVSRSITAATSMTVSSGSTLGHESSVNRFIYVYAIDNAGTVELAVSSSLYDEGELVSTTAEGGAGAADSVTAIYSTTARSNVSLRLIARLRSLQTTAGTWIDVMQELVVLPFKQLTSQNELYLETGNGFGSTNTLIRRFSNTKLNVGTAFTYADSSTNGASVTIVTEGVYAISYADVRSGAAAIHGISVNGTVGTSIQTLTYDQGKRGAVGTAAATTGVVSVILNLKPGDVVRPHTNGNQDGASAQNYFHLTKIS